VNSFSNVSETNINASDALVAGKAILTDDLDLVHATQRGDVSAFEQLVARYDGKLLASLKTLRTIGKTPRTRSRRPS
jgi:hypothetical protein